MSEMSTAKEGEKEEDGVFEPGQTGTVSVCLCVDKHFILPVFIFLFPAQFHQQQQ